MSGHWPPAAATGVGSLPGRSALEAARIVAGEVPEFVHVVELPARGPGSDAVGRTGGLLSAVSPDLGLETTAAGWRIAGGVGRQMRRAASWLGEDLDALEQTSAGYGGPVKGQVVGPWTFAASVELAGGERMLRDFGAVREVAGALAEAAAAHVAVLRRRVPAASAVVVQVDEPGLRAVLDGSIGTASGLSAYAPVDPQAAGQVLAGVFEAIAAAGGVPVAHCCAARPPVALLRASGAAAIGVDLLLGDDPGTDAQLGAALEAGAGVFAGTVAALGSGAPSDTRAGALSDTQASALSDTQASAPVRGLLHRLGLTDDRWLAQIAITPTCGLAGASPDWARTALAACRAVGRVLRADTEPRS